jgi:hypothetical protein
MLVKWDAINEPDALRQEDEKEEASDELSIADAFAEVGHERLSFVSRQGMRVSTTGEGGIDSI